MQLKKLKKQPEFKKICNDFKMMRSFKKSFGKLRTEVNFTFDVNMLGMSVLFSEEKAGKIFDNCR